MQYKPPHHPRYDDVTASHDARLAAAVLHLASWFGFDLPDLSISLDERISDCLLEGTPYDDGTGTAIEDAIRDDLADDYAGKPEACLSFINAYVADQRQKERKLKP